MELDGYEVTNLCKSYLDNHLNSFSVLKNISFKWNQGENIAILGESGSGKSTIARLLIGIEKPTSGSIKLDNVDTLKWNAAEWRKHRNKVQAVFQDATGTLNPALSALHNVEEALCNLTDLSKQEKHQRIDELMKLSHMSKDLLKVPARQLSGGEQRRLSLVRALAIHPQYLVLDEVTSGLDSISTDAILNLLMRYHEEYGCAYLIITHDIQVAYQITHSIYKINKGTFTKKAILNNN